MRQPKRRILYWKLTFSMINLLFQDENIGWKHSVPGGPCFSFPFQISVCFYTILQTTKPGPLKNFRISYITIRATHLHAKFGVDSTYPGKVWINGFVSKKRFLWRRQMTTQLSGYFQDRKVFLCGQEKSSQVSLWLKKVFRIHSL